MKQLTTMLVEPSLPEGGLLMTTLQSLGFKVVVKTSIAESVAFLGSHEPVHLVLANWIQQGSTGLDLTDAVHQHAKVLLPVFLYSRSVDGRDVIAATKAGATTLLRSPISQHELYQHLNPVLRDRYPWAYPSRSVVGDIELDRDTHVVTRRGRRVHLTPGEFRLLETLARKPGVVFSREELLEAVSKREKSSVRAIDVQVTRLKLHLTIRGSPPPIRAVRGRGYMIT